MAAPSMAHFPDVPRPALIRALPTSGFVRLLSSLSAAAEASAPGVWVWDGEIWQNASTATMRIAELALELDAIPDDDDYFVVGDSSDGRTKRIRSSRVRGGLASASALASAVATIPTTAMITATARQTLLSTVRDSLGRFPGIVPPSFNLFMGDATADTAPTGTFTRSTTATRQGQTGLVETVAAAGARRSWNDDGSPRGWLIEDSRTNVALYGRDLTNAVWVKSGCTAALTQTGIDGAANTASLLTATADGATCLQAASVSSSARFQTAWLRRVAGTGAVSVTMDGGATWTDVTSQLTSVWTRVSIPGQTLATLSIGFKLATSGDAIGVDGVQNEAGAFQTATIFTTSTAVARSADVWTVALASSWFKAAGTFFLAARTPNGVTAATARNIFQLDDGTNNNRLRVYRDGTRGVSAGAYAVGASVGSVAIGTINDATAFKMALSFGASLVAVSLNGAEVVTGALSAFPTAFSTLRIGADLSGAYQWCGHLLHLAYWPQTLTSAQLKALTA